MSKSRTMNVLGVKVKKGGKVTLGPYRLIHTKSKRAFVGSLVHTINKGSVRLAIFSVPKE